MSPKFDGRTATCDRGQAQTRLAHAQKFLDVADLVATEDDIFPASASVAAALAVLAGIAAADAACCAALGHRARGQDHKQAVALVQQVSPGGLESAKYLDRLLDLKDTAHYGVINVSSVELRSALRRARALVEFANGFLRT